MVDEDVSDGQLSVVAGTHCSRPAGHIVAVSQPRVSLTESSKNHIPTPVSLKRRGSGGGGFLHLLERILIIQTIPGDPPGGPNLSRVCEDVVRIWQSGLYRGKETSGLHRQQRKIC